MANNHAKATDARHLWKFTTRGAMITQYEYAHRVDICLGVSVFRGSTFLMWQFIYSGEVKRSGKGQNASGLFSTGDGDTPVQYLAGLRACIWGLSYVSERSRKTLPLTTLGVHGTQACW